MADPMLVTFTVNARPVRVSVEPRRTLADCLRHDLHLTGTHVGCEHGVCGACTVLVDGEPASSCMILAVEVDGSDIRTVEGLAGSNPRLREAFTEQRAYQCGFCTSGFLVMGQYLIDKGLANNRGEIKERLNGHICRCTGYEPIIDAIVAAGEEPN